MSKRIEKKKLIKIKKSIGPRRRDDHERVERGASHRRLFPPSLPIFFLHIFSVAPFFPLSVSFS